tara:strand:+ start:8538 stop:8879 length:342 start_codon:yes stop_codon:yes gene_type:complete
MRFDKPKDPIDEIMVGITREFPWLTKADGCGIIPAELVIDEKNPLRNLVRWVLQVGFDMGLAAGVETGTAQAIGARVELSGQFARFVAFAQCLAIDEEVLTENTINAFLKAGE